MAASRFEAHGDYSRAKEMLDLAGTPGAQRQLEQITSRRCASLAEEKANLVYAEHRIGDVASLAKEAKQAADAWAAAFVAEKEKGGISVSMMHKALGVVRIAVLGRAFDLAVATGVEAMTAALEPHGGLQENHDASFSDAERSSGEPSEGRTRVQETEEVCVARQISKWLCCISLVNLEATDRIRVMAFEGYMGVLEAIRRDYIQVVEPLCNFTIDRSSRIPTRGLPEKCAPPNLTLRAARVINPAFGLPGSLIARLQKMVAERQGSEAQANPNP
ncbi:hypothetical protein T484DRAFT_2827555 [Baffinella frigidus]|nr:hypothetical protein T484DRAFT_2827555 [Cryptophyta sp. CCMP2293]